MSFNFLSKQAQLGILIGGIVFGGGGSFVAWSENQLSIPGGIRDIEFWEQATASAEVMGDLIPFSGYLHQRVANILAFPQRSYEGLLTFSFMDSTVQAANPSRRLEDIKYALAVYKKQQLLYTPPSAKFYMSLKKLFRFQQNLDASENPVISSSASRLKIIHDLVTSEKKESVKSILEEYQIALENPEFLNFKASLMLRLAYFLYEQDPEESMRWVRKIEKLHTNKLIQQASNDLKKRALAKKRNKQKSKSAKSAEAQVMSLMSEGLLDEALTLIQQVEGEGESIQMNEARTWLSPLSEEALKGKQAFFSEYFRAVNNAAAQPARAAKQLADLAASENSIGYSAILRYQAWGLAYFDAKSYSQAFLYAQLLKIKDPLSDYSQLSSMEGLFRSAESVYTGENLLKLWEKEPYRFEVIQKKNDWIGFKDAEKRVSETLVHEGQVYVLRYGSEGKVASLKKAIAGEMVVEGQEEDAIPKQPLNTQPLKQSPKAGLLKKSVQTGWMDQFFYDYMNRYIPLAVRVFKNQLWEKSEHLKDPTFTRFYSESEFQQYVIDKMRPALGKTAQGIHSQIDEDGFHLYSTLNLNGLKVPVIGSGKLVTEGQDGQLILKMDHVKVGGVYLPEWLLRRTEKNFNYKANASISSQSAPIDIIDMDYRNGGILIKCRKRTS